MVTTQSISSTINETANNFNHLRRWTWLLPVTITTAMVLITTWILISLIHFGIKSGKWRKTQSKSEVLNSGLVYTSLVLCAFACLFRYGSSLTAMSVGFNDYDHALCNAAGDLAYLSYALVLGFVALFLWFRQRAFYSNSLLNVNYNKIIKFFSAISIICIIGYGLAAVILITPLNIVEASLDGCVFTGNSNMNSSYWLSTIIGIVFYNTTLLGLLIYALTHASTFQKFQKARDKARKEQGINSQAEKRFSKISTDRLMPSSEDSQQTNLSSSETNFRSKPRQQGMSSSNKIKVILQKTLIFCILSILCDVLLQIYSNFIVKPYEQRRFVYMLYDVNALLNLLYLIFSFVSYKEMLTSPRCNCRT